MGQNFIPNDQAGIVFVFIFSMDCSVLYVIKKAVPPIKIGIYIGATIEKCNMARTILSLVRLNLNTCKPALILGTKNAR